MLQSLFLKILFIFRERGREGEREGEKQQCVVDSHMRPPLGTWPTAQACTLTGNRTGDPLLHGPHSLHRATPARADYGLKNEVINESRIRELLL